ncbi:sigma-70 family RNA polymerase sigma factor [Vallitaleaceae bacterium 9-2]
MDTVEEKLIKKAQKGNVKAFEKLILQHEDHIYAIALKVLKNEADAYDAAQEICLKIYQKIDQFKFESAFSTWVHRLAINTAIDEYRKIKRKQQKEYSYDQPITDDNNTMKDFIEDTNDTPENSVVRQEQIQMVWQALEKLKEEQRNIIIMKDIEGRSYQEISESLQINMGTVKSRLARSRIALKEVLKDSWEQSSV